MSRRNKNTRFSSNNPDRAGGLRRKAYASKREAANSRMVGRAFDAAQFEAAAARWSDEAMEAELEDTDVDLPEFDPYDAGFLDSDLDQCVAYAFGGA